MSERDRSFVLRTIVLVLAVCALSVVAVLLAGLFNPQVDNEKIFSILQPMSQQISGALISILSGLIAVKSVLPTKKDGEEK